eukprot:9439446-Lingulodinium_polyedra.AAC.1
MCVWILRQPSTPRVWERATESMAVKQSRNGWEGALCKPDVVAADVERNESQWQGNRAYLQ